MFGGVLSHIHLFQSKPMSVDLQMCSKSLYSTTKLHPEKILKISKRNMYFILQTYLLNFQKMMIIEPCLSLLKQNLNFHLKRPKIPLQHYIVVFDQNTNAKHFLVKRKINNYDNMYILIYHSSYVKRQLKIYKVEYRLSRGTLRAFLGVRVKEAIK